MLYYISLEKVFPGNIFYKLSFYKSQGFKSSHGSETFATILKTENVRKFFKKLSINLIPLLFIKVIGM